MSGSSITRFPDGRTDIYDGGKFIGSVTARGGRFIAKDRSGESLGDFADKKPAVDRVVAYRNGAGGADQRSSENEPATKARR